MASRPSWSAEQLREPRASRGTDPQSDEAEPNLVFCDPAAAAARSRPHGNRKVRFSSVATREELQKVIASERKARTELEARCRALEAAAQIGYQADVIAHELRNPLFSIGGFAELLQRRVDPDDRVERWIQRILESVEGIDRVLTTVVSLSRVELPNPEPVGSAEILSAAAAVLETELAPQAHGYTLAIESPPGLSLRVDSALAKEAVLHLLRNAVEAGAERVSVQAKARSAGSVAIVVEDDGEGIRDALREKIRRLFFSTRTGADGIGLNRVDKIAILHGGTLTLRNRPTGGTRAELTLPRHGSEPKLGWPDPSGRGPGKAPADGPPGRQVSSPPHPGMPARGLD